MERTQFKRYTEFSIHSKFRIELLIIYAELLQLKLQGCSFHLWLSSVILYLTDFQLLLYRLGPRDVDLKTVND